MIRALKYLNLIFFLLMITVNALANILPFGYGNTGAISSKYQNLFTPAPITFSIWGIIYLMLSIFIVYQLDLFNSQMFAKSFSILIGPWFVISCIMNICWIFSWHYDYMQLSMVFMIGLLISLIMIVSRFSPSIVEQANGHSTFTMLAKMSFYTFDIYLGWITAATIANASVLLVKMNWNRFGLSETFWTNTMLIVGALLGILYIIVGQRYMASVAMIWAYCGILIKHISSSGYNGTYPSIIITAIFCIIILLLSMKIAPTFSTSTKDEYRPNQIHVDIKSQ